MATAPPVGTTNTLATPNHVPGPDGNQVYHYNFHAYDFRNPKMQQLWAQRITDAVATGYVDGSFIDGNRGGWGFGNCNACLGDAECIAELKAGLETAHRLVATTAGPKATLISNCTRCLSSTIIMIMLLSDQYVQCLCSI